MGYGTGVLRVAGVRWRGSSAEIVPPNTSGKSAFEVDDEDIPTVGVSVAELRVDGLVIPESVRSRDK